MIFLLSRKLRQNRLFPISYGVSGKELDWFIDYLFQRQQLVDIENYHSDRRTVYTGVPQGSILGPLLFTLFFNDFPDQLRYCETIKYADDTVIYYANKDFLVIENRITEDLQSISKFFDQNELIINLKKGKTECMLLGSAKRLSNVPREFTVFYRKIRINLAKEYKYLGIIIDHHLSFNHNFDSSYKKASNRLRLLEKMRLYMDENTAERIYKSMIVPLLTYSGIVCLHRSNSQLAKFTSLENRASKIIASDTSLPQIQRQIMKESCHMVRKCIDRETCRHFNSYFTINKHSIGTRNNGILLMLPKVKLSVAKQSFYFYGAKTYNSLPKEIRSEESLIEFKRLLNNHFA